MSLYPLMLEGTAIDVVIVGGGPVAARKARALAAAGARVDIVAEDFAPECTGLIADFSSVVLTTKAYDHRDIDRAMLVVCATNDTRVNAIIAKDAMDRGKLVNVADDPDLGNCVTAAVHRTGDIVIGVSAGGVPTAARRIRDTIARIIDDRYASAIAELAKLRRSLLDDARRDRWRDAADALTGPDFAEQVRSPDYVAKVARWR